MGKVITRKLVRAVKGSAALLSSFEQILSKTRHLKQIKRLNSVYECPDGTPELNSGKSKKALFDLELNQRTAKCSQKM